ncbi:MAG: DUF4349 domain-containing protein [Firmicutes bacterium]|nr:DUF4349 domain-containing protein [Bacillota bacterium]
MKKKIICLFAVVLIALFLFSGCMAGMNSGGSDSMQNAPNGGGSGGSVTDILEINVGNRKVIFYYNCEMYTEDFAKSIAVIASALEATDGAYVESSNSSRVGGLMRAHYTVRVKSEDFATFVSAIKTAGEVSYDILTSKDITTEYYGLEAQIEALEGELLMWQAQLVGTTTISERTNIQNRITNLQKSINELYKVKDNYDTLVELCTVNITVREGAPAPAKERPNFGTRITSAFKSIGLALAYFFEYLLYIVVCLIGFGGVPTAIVLLIIYLRKKYIRKKTAPCFPATPVAQMPQTPIINCPAETPKAEENENKDKL